MGLDMHLSKVKSTPAAYWHKAYAINNWFEKNIADGELENCRDYTVSKEKLEELRDICQKVLDSCKLVDKEATNGKHSPKVIEDTTVAEELLPVVGWYSDWCNYDEYYYKDVKDTLEQVTAILEDTDFDTTDIVYWAWW